MRSRGRLTTAGAFVAVCLLALAPALFPALGRTERQREDLPKSFDSPFSPQDISPDIAVISLTPGIEHGQYEIRMTLAQTALHDTSGTPRRHYIGEFVGCRARG
jgi:hypothetical protein